MKIDHQIMIQNGNLQHSNETLFLGLIGLYYRQIYFHLKEAEGYYPNFQNWFFHQVLPEIVTNQREIFLERRGDKIAGMAIVKKGQEKKLSTLKVMEPFQKQGIGLKLFEKCFKILDTTKPFLTVSEERLPQFEKLFRYYGFQMSSVHEGLYRVGKKEYFFNEE